MPFSRFLLLGGLAWGATNGVIIIFDSILTGSNKLNTYIQQQGKDDKKGSKKSSPTAPDGKKYKQITLGEMEQARIQLEELEGG